MPTFLNLLLFETKFSNLKQKIEIYNECIQVESKYHINFEFNENLDSFHMGVMLYELAQYQLKVIIAFLLPHTTTQSINLKKCTHYKVGYLFQIK